MKISVVIPTSGKREFLGKCLEAIGNNAFRPEEIFVVGPTSGEIRGEMTTGLPKKVNFVDYPTHGASQARNLGIKSATAEVMAFTDDDCLPATDWLEKINSLFERGDTAALCGQVIPLKETGQLPLALWMRNETTLFKGLNNPWLVGGAGNLAIKREVFDRIGYFDETLGPGTLFKSGEDADFVYRLLRSGIPVLFSPEVKVSHLGWRSAGQNFRLRFDYGLGMGGMLQKHISGGERFASHLLQGEMSEHLKQLRAGLRGKDTELLLEGLPYCCGITVGVFLRILWNSRGKG